VIYRAPRRYNKGAPSRVSNVVCWLLLQCALAVRKGVKNQGTARGARRASCRGATRVRADGVFVYGTDREMETRRETQRHK